MVDYSKWDKIEISDDEEEKPQPKVWMNKALHLKVTKLEPNSRVTFGKGQVIIQSAKEVV